MNYKQKALQSCKAFCFNQYNTRKIAAKQQKGGKDFAALPQRPNSFYTFFVRFGIILPIKSLFLKKVISTRRFASKLLIHSLFPLTFSSFLQSLYKQAFQRIGKGFLGMFFGETSCLSLKKLTHYTMKQSMIFMKSPQTMFKKIISTKEITLRTRVASALSLFLHASILRIKFKRIKT